MPYSIVSRSSYLPNEDDEREKAHKEQEREQAGLPLLPVSIQPLMPIQET
jgi:hypothetical protein